MGAERFWPSSNDFKEEVDKCVRILRFFTEEGVIVSNNPLAKHKVMYVRSLTAAKRFHRKFSVTPRAL